MIFDNKRVISIAVATALLGGTVGAFISRSGKSADTASTQTAAPATAAQTTQPAATDTNQLAQNDPAYRDGFVDGIRTVLEGGKAQAGTNTVVERQTAQPARVVYRNSRSGSNATSARSNSSRRVYYDYEQPQKRSFWQKHRDKLTVAAGAGGGALIGGLIGGKKGAAIGALAGGGGSALYTYKIRKRNRSY
ncbi:MAG TPA: hypothetical protein VGC66_22535 [Pyrinomonadaceae bacterium]|jgi:hypothetical protein